MTPHKDTTNKKGTVKSSKGNEPGTQKDVVVIGKKDKNGK